MHVPETRKHDRRPRDPDLDAGDEQGEEQVLTGTIVAHHGVAVQVRLDRAPTQAGERRLIKVRRRSGHVVGDRVEVVGERLIQHERRNELRRRDAFGRVHVVAANLDVLGIVVAPVPPSPLGFVDRALVAAAASGITPVLVLNKADLPDAAELEQELRSTWPCDALGEPLRLFTLSAAEQQGLEPLVELLSRGSGRRAVFIGTSGVGKSSLLNVLLPDLELQVGEINQASGLGRHTTTTATLHALPKGGELIDTPGFRDFGLVEIEGRELARYFPGFDAVLRTHPCRFSDCLHRSEPDCAIKRAVEKGSLARERWQLYQQILAGL
jgi:ribosome biogenesis GTPase